MNSKYALADCSLIFSFFSNCDRSCVYSSSTVGAAAHCFINVILQGTDLSVPLVPLGCKKYRTGFLTLIYYIWKKNYFHRWYNKNKIRYYYSKISHYQKHVQSTIQSDTLTGITTYTMILNPNLPNSVNMYSTSVIKHNSYAFHLHINSSDAVKPLQVATVSAKQFQSVYCTSTVAISMVNCTVQWCFAVASHLAIRHFKSYKLPQALCHNWQWTWYYY